MSPQQTIAHYRILAKIGEGGMGTVYRAVDTKLNREVAIKVLPEVFASDGDRMARFTREAQVLASLNHPNIAAIYGVEERAIVLELVEGPTLAERVAAGAIPVEDALPVARQIAEALEYAHEKGVVHRDLKPANIKVTAEGRVKVLDFGLAKALANETVAGDPASSPTLTMTATMAGVIMGTAGYMSPEQAKGKPVDRRADIWAFGVVLYEMLTGRLLYTGETVSETLASVIKDKPALDGLPADTPPRIVRLLRRCLEKDPQRRLQAIGEARVLIDTPEEAGPAPVAAPPVSKSRPWLWAVAGVAAGAALVYSGFRLAAPAPPDRPLVRLSVDMGPGAHVEARTAMAISPDGTRLAFPVAPSAIDVARLAVRRMDDSAITVLNGTQNPSEFAFSPDGEWIAYSAPPRLWKIAVRGGSPIPLCDCVMGGHGLDWAGDGYIYGEFGSLKLERLPVNGGQLETVLAVTKEDSAYRWPQMLTGGDAILFTASRAPNTEVRVLSLRSKTVKTLVRGGSYGRYLPGGYLVYLAGNTLFAMRFDPARLEVSGTAVPLLDDAGANESTGKGLFSFSQTGIFAYLNSSAVDRPLPLVYLDANGSRPLIPAQTGLITTPRLSPDGRLLAAAIHGDLWVFDPERGASTRITTGLGASYPVWAPDGRAIAFMWGATGIGLVRSDGSTPPQRIYNNKISVAIPGSFTPDGKHLTFHAMRPGGPSAIRDINQLTFESLDPDHPKAGAEEPLVQTDTVKADPMFSPDGRWLAYISGSSSTYHVFVRPYGEGAQGGQAQVSTTPGRFPLWSRTSQEIFYVTQDGRIQVVPYTVNGRTFVPGKPRVWSATPIRLNGVAYPLDIAPNGKSFVAALATDPEAKTNVHFTFLLNFFDEVGRKLASQH